MEYLIVTALGSDQKTVVKELIQIVAKHQCNIQDSRMTTLGNHIGIIMLVGGNWNAIAKLESALSTAPTKAGMRTMLERAENPKIADRYLPYLVQVVALDSPGIIYEICDFFTLQSVKINELQSNPFTASYTGTPMITVTASISIPTDLNLSDLRENFMLLCDELNVDGILEPEKR
jgi:glycine cleavage system transcriptional repressor